MTLKRYAIRSKHNGQLLKLKVSTEVEISSYFEPQIGFDDILEHDYKLKNIYFLESVKTNHPIYFSKRKEIAEKVLKSFNVDKSNSIEMPFIKLNVSEGINSFEIIEVSLEF